MSTLAPTPDADQLALLADAIADVGYWTWWAQELPDVFQVEFAGTQLYFAPPVSPDQPPIQPGRLTIPAVYQCMLLVPGTGGN